MTPAIILTPKLRQAWELGPFAAGLKSLYLDTSFLKLQYMKKLYGTKNYCVHVQLGQTLNQKI